MVLRSRNAKESDRTICFNLYPFSMSLLCNSHFGPYLSYYMTKYCLSRNFMGIYILTYMILTFQGYDLCKVTVGILFSHLRIGVHVLVY